METILVATFIGFIGLITVLKNRLPQNQKFILTFVTGMLLLLWFWRIPDNLNYWRVVVGVIIFTSWIRVVYGGNQSNTFRE